MRWTTVTFMPRRVRPCAASKAEQAAADHDRLALLLAGLRRGQHGVDILHVAKADNARQILARHEDDEGIGAGGDQQLVIAEGAARFAR